MCVFVCGHVHTECSAPGGQMGASDPLKQEAVGHLRWVLGTELQSSIRAVAETSPQSQFMNFEK